MKNIKIIMAGVVVSVMVSGCAFKNPDPSVYPEVNLDMQNQRFGVVAAANQYKSECGESMGFLSFLKSLSFTPRPLECE